MLVVDIIVNQLIRMCIEKQTPEIKNSLILSKQNVVLVVVINHKFLISKRLEEKILLKMQNVHMGIDQLCQIRHGVILIKNLLF